MEFAVPYWLTLFAGFLFALIFTPISRALALAAGFIDEPRADRMHRRPTPFLGGIAVALAAGLAFVALAPRVPLLGQLWDSGILPRTTVPLLLFLSGGALLFGLLDDRIELSPRQKLIGQTLLGIVLMAATIPGAWSLELLLWPVGMLWVVGLLNAFNLLDNMDGVLGGVGTLVGLFLGALALKMGRPDMGLLALAAAGASLGFLCFNLPPATIFLGDAGAFFIGMLLAGVGWELGGSSFLSLGSEAAAIVLIMAYPIFDITFVAITRFLDKRPIHRGGIDHTTHRCDSLLRGPRALVLIYGLTLLGGLAGLVAAYSVAPVAWSLVAVLAFLYGSLGVILARVPVRSRALPGTPPAVVPVGAQSETPVKRDVA